MWGRISFSLFRSTGYLLLFLIAACARPVEVVPPVVPPPVVAPEKIEPLSPVSWDAIGGWRTDDLAQALDPLLQSCQVLKKRDGWAEVCRDAAALDGADPLTLRHFFEERFVPYRVRNSDGSETGTITGYYIPDLRGSRNRSEQYPYPLYGIPDDLLVIDLRSLYPELGDYRLRGRLEGRRVVPYWSRGDIDQGKGSVAGQVLFWVADPVELFFLHVQGSGRILLDNGESAMVHFGDQNGHPYRSIGKWLIDREEMTRDEMSMQNIIRWAQQNPDRVKTLLAENPSYVFFIERPPSLKSPPGALGVPLSPGRSLAIDPRTIPLGAPVFLDTTWPSSPLPLQRLMVAQDTGGAIKGAVRADFFWGMGDFAGDYAGKMKQSGRLWVLLPKELNPLKSAK
jgi:membrane-bound lytic murein transglycosylase A